LFSAEGKTAQNMLKDGWYAWGEVKKKSKNAT